MMWQSGLPVVTKMADWPCLVWPRNVCERLRGEDGVDGDLHIARGGVLESDRTGEAGDELAVDLAFGGARADGSPADEVGDVLRRDHVEEFGAGGHAHFGEIEQRWRAMRRPSLILKEPSRWGSLMRPFQPMVVRGFSK